MLKRNAYSTIGLDLGETSVKLVQLRAASGGRWKLHAAARVAFSRADGGNGDIDARRARFSAIKGALAEHGFVGRKVASVLRPVDTLIRPIKLPKQIDGTDRSALWDAVRTEARRYIPYPVEDAVLDFLTIGTVRGDEDEKLEVLLIAARADKVNEHISLIESAGLRCVGINVVPCAVFAASKHLVGRDYADVVAAIELGERVTAVGIARPDKLLFSRSINIGGGMLTEAIAEALELGRDRAELFKRRYGIDHCCSANATASDETRIHPETIPGVLYELCHEQLKRLAYEVKRSVDYFMAQVRGVKVGKTLLFGGGAHLKGLPGFLADYTGLDVQVGDPLALMEGDEPDSGPNVADDVRASFAVALGLALGEE